MSETETSETEGAGETEVIREPERLGEANAVVEAGGHAATEAAENDVDEAEGLSGEVAGASEPGGQAAGEAGPSESAEASVPGEAVATSEAERPSAGEAVATSEAERPSAGEAGQSGDLAEAGLKVERAEQAETAEQVGQVEQVEQAEQVEQVGQVERVEQVEQVGQVERAEQAEQAEQVETAEQVGQVERVERVERIEHDRQGLDEKRALARALVQLLSAGALVPEHVYSRRGFRARLKELRPATAEADLAAVVRAIGVGGGLPGVELRCPQGRQIMLSLGPGQRGQVSIHQGDNLQILAGLGDGSVDLIYIDPPFNTGIMQTRTRLKTARDDEGDRVGFRGERYRSVRLGTRSFADTFDDYLGFLAPRLEHAHRLLCAGGSLFLHLDYREVHYAKVLLDQIFGRASFINEIIWAYDYGGRTTKRWPPKHDNILWYARNPEDYCFNYDAIDRIPYMAPGLVGKAKAARGKTPTDTWWHTIVSPGSREKNGYPTQKPLGILHRIVRVHTQPGDTILDFFAGSGSIGESAAMHGRHAILIDRNPEAIAVMKERLARFEPMVITAN